MIKKLNNTLEVLSYVQDNNYAVTSALVNHIKIEEAGEERLVVLIRIRHSFWFNLNLLVNSKFRYKYKKKIQAEVYDRMPELEFTVSVNVELVL